MKFKAYVKESMWFMKKTKHTPTPWFNRGKIIRAASGKNDELSVSIARTNDPTMCEVNAAHIVKCVNMHDELIKAYECHSICKCIRADGTYANHLGREIYCKGAVIKICNRCDLLTRAKAE